MVNSLLTLIESVLEQCEKEGTDLSIGVEVKGKSKEEKR